MRPIPATGSSSKAAADKQRRPGGPWFSKRMDPMGRRAFLVRWIDSGHEASAFWDRMRSSSPPPSRQSKIAQTGRRIDLVQSALERRPGRFRGTRDLMSDTVQEPS